jgi:hypothetical protein
MAAVRADSNALPVRAEQSNHLDVALMEGAAAATGRGHSRASAI